MAQYTNFYDAWVAKNTPPSTPAPAPSYSPPVDPVYDNTVSNANYSYGNAISDLNYQETSGAQNFGFNAQGNFDPSNPFSRAALLQQSFQDAQRRTTNSYAARGQLYSGAIANAGSSNQRGYDQNYDSLRRSADSYYQNILSRRNAARASRDTTITNAEAVRLPNDIAANAPDPATLAPTAPQKTPFRKSGQYSGLSLKQRQGYWARRRQQRGY